MNLESMHIKRGFWRAWVSANVLGLGAGMALFALIGEGFKQGNILGSPKDNVIIGHLIGLLLAGALFGIAQWLVLRRYIPWMGWVGLAASAGEQCVLVQKAYQQYALKRLKRTDASSLARVRPRTKPTPRGSADGAAVGDLDGEPPRPALT